MSIGKRILFGLDGGFRQHYLYPYRKRGSNTLLKQIKTTKKCLTTVYTRHKRQNSFQLFKKSG
jgi:hypothetical protein